MPPKDSTPTTEAEEVPILAFAGWTLVDQDTLEPLFHSDGPIPQQGDTVILSTEGGYLVFGRTYCPNHNGDLLIQVHARYTAVDLFDEAYKEALAEMATGDES